LYYHPKKNNLQEQQSHAPQEQLLQQLQIQQRLQLQQQQQQLQQQQQQQEIINKKKLENYIQRPVNIYSPHYATYMGIKPKATTSAKLTMTGSFMRKR